MAGFSLPFHLVMPVMIACVIDLDLSESSRSPAFVFSHLSSVRHSHQSWKRLGFYRQANIPNPSASRCQSKVGTFSLSMSRSKESDEIVFVPGQTPKSQPRRGSGSKWEQWFGAMDERPVDGQIQSDENAVSSAEDDDVDAASIKAGENLKRLQSATHNSLDWKVRTHSVL